MVKNLLLVLIFFILMLLNAAIAKDIAILHADSINYSHNNKFIVASGNAHLQHQNRKLSASKIIYLKKEKKIIASRNVVFEDENGDIYYFDYIVSDIEFKNANAVNIKSKFKKILNWSAADGFINHNVKKVHSFIFSPCNNCTNDIIKDKLLWQIKAEEVELNDQKEEVILKNAVIEFLDRPVLYLPHISLPSPQAKPRTGFLIPNMSFSKEMGMQVEIPYYFKLAPNMDTTFAPVISTEISTLYKLEFRHLLRNGQYQINSTLINQKNTQQNDEISGHVKIDGDFKGKISDLDINYGLHLSRLFDQRKTYLKKYNLSDDNILNSHLYINNNFIDKNYRSHFISLETLSFQDLRPDSIDEITPNVLPLIRYNQLYHLDFLDTKIEFSSAFYNIVTKSQDNDSSKLVTDISFNNRIITDTGHEFNIKNGIYNYLHQYNNVNIVNKNNINYVNIVPYSQVRWRYEMMMLSPNYKNHFIIEPTVALMLAHNQFSSQEDELLEIRKSNFFTPNRFLDFESSDLISRFDYGVNLFFKNKSIDAITFFLGNSIYMNNLANKKKYNYISNASLQLNQNTFIVNRMWFNQKNFKVVQHEIDTLMKFNKLNLGLSYTYKDQLEDRFFPQELSGCIDFNFYQKWWLHLHAKLKLNNSKIFSTLPEIDDKRKLLKDGIGLTYKDDCLQVDFTVNRDHTKLKDLKPSTTYIIKIGVPIFKRL